MVPSEPLKEWLAGCPAPVEFMEKLGYHVWLLQTKLCFNCGEEHKVADMRHDACYFASGELICKRCWTSFDGGTIACPDYKSPPWPAKLEPFQQMLLRGDLTDASGVVLGTVEGYNPRIHFARLRAGALTSSSTSASTRPGPAA